MIPNENYFCELDPDVVDQWGIPVLRFHLKWSDYEIKMAKDMQQTFRAIVEAAGGNYIEPEVDPEHPLQYFDGGAIVHELGGARMGADSKNFGAERILPGPRGEKSFCHRRRGASPATRIRIRR